VIVSAVPRAGMGGLILWNAEGGPAWRNDIPAGWVTCGDWNGDQKPEIFVSVGGGGGDGWELLTGAGERVYAITGIGYPKELVPGVEGAPLRVWTRNKGQEDKETPVGALATGMHGGIARDNKPIIRGLEEDLTANLFKWFEETQTP